MIELKGKYNKDCKIFIDDIESEAISLIQNILDNKVSEDVPVRIMPDVHAGKGITIGYCAPMTNLLNPNHIGCDIGCGVIGGFFKSDKKFDLSDLDKKIRKAIPTGFNLNDESPIKKYSFDEVQKTAEIFIKKYNEKFNTSYSVPEYSEKWLSKKLKEIGMDEEKFWKSLKTMGGSNHYIELTISELKEYMISIHCGSRNFGLKIADYHVNQAKKQKNYSEDEYSKLFNDITLNTKDKSTIHQKLKELKEKFEIGIDREYLKGDYMMNYLYDMIFAQHYASLNRKLILDDIREILGVKFDNVIDTVHNYINFNDFIIRKGAISAHKDEMVLIPLNMRDGVLLCKGKGNSDWNYSLNHGAGRLMSRSAAKAKFELSEFKETMKNVYSSSIIKTNLDESPMAYKNSKMIEELMEPNAEIIDRFIPILNIKDNSSTETFKERKNNKKIRDKERYQLRNFKEMNQ